MRIKNLFLIVLLILFTYTLIPENLFSQETATDRMDPLLWGFNWGKIRKYVMYGKMNMYNKTFSDTTLFSGPYWRFTPTTRLKTESYSYAFQINDNGASGTPLVGYMTGRAAKKTYGLYVNLARPADSTATGDSNDALLRLNYNNHAANDNNFIMRAINASLANRSGGNIGIMEGASIGVQGKSGGTTPYIRGMTITPENYGTCATEFSGIDIVMKNEGAKATLEYGVRVRNLNNSLGTYIDAGLLFSDTGVNIGFNYILDANGATVNAAEFRLSNAETIDNITNGTVQVVTPVFKQAYDAAAYWTATQADAGAVTFNSVSDGTPGFTFSDAITLNGNLGITGKAVIDGVRADNTQGYEYWLNVGGAITSTGDGAHGAKTFGLNLSMSRAAGVNTANGDMEDALIKGTITNRATANTASYIVRGINVTAMNRDANADQDDVNWLEGAYITAKNQTALTGSAEMRGVYCRVDLDPATTATTETGALKAELDLDANAPSVSYGVQAYYQSAGAYTLPQYALWVNTGTADKWEYGLAYKAGSINNADMLLSSGAKVFTGTAANGDAIFAEVGAKDAVGSIYLNATNGYVYIQVANTEAATDWFKVTATDAD